MAFRPLNSAAVMKTMVILCSCVTFSTSVVAEPGTGTTSSNPSAKEGLATLANKIRRDFYLGSFASGLNPSREDNKQAAEIFKHNFNIMTAGIYMSGTQRERGKYTLERLDALIDYANANNIKVYLHPMIGGDLYSPEWINKGTFTKEELETVMRDRITTILTRYKGKVQYVDVVNEALGRSQMTTEGEFDWAGTRGGNMWMKTLGMYQGKKYKFPQYLVDAFRIAREVGDKTLTLVLNEGHANATINNPWGPISLAAIKALKEEGIPVDDAGIQLHCSINDGKLYEWGNVLFDFDGFDAMAEEVMRVRKIDVAYHRIRIFLCAANPTEADFQLQGKYYAEILEHAIKSPAVKSFKTWGFTDKAAWNRGRWNGGVTNGHPLLLDEELKPKPAYIRQVEMLRALAKQQE